MGQHIVVLHKAGMKRGGGGAPQPYDDRGRYAGGAGGAKGGGRKGAAPAGAPPPFTAVNQVDDIAHDDNPVNAAWLRATDRFGGANPAGSRSFRDLYDQELKKDGLSLVRVPVMSANSVSVVQDASGRQHAYIKMTGLSEAENESFSAHVGRSFGLYVPHTQVTVSKDGDWSASISQPAQRVHGSMSHTQDMPVHQRAARNLVFSLASEDADRHGGNVIQLTPTERLGTRAGRERNSVTESAVLIDWGLTHHSATGGEAWGARPAREKLQYLVSPGRNSHNFYINMGHDMNWNAGHVTRAARDLRAMLDRDPGLRQLDLGTDGRRLENMRGYATMLSDRGTAQSVLDALRTGGMP